MKNKGYEVKFNERKKTLFLVYLICILLASVTATTYAFLEYYGTESESQELAGADLTVTISKVKPSTNNTVTNLIPLSEDDLELAISSEYSCRDNNNLDICHIYKIDVANGKESSLKVDGFLDINVTDGEVTNLKYKLMESTTTLGTNTSRYAYVDMENQFVKEVNLASRATNTYYVVVWIEDTGGEQLDEGNISVSARFKASSISSSTIDNYLVSFSGTGDTSYFHSDTYREKIKNIAFVNYIDTTNAVASWDMGTLQNGGIIAWVENNPTSGFYDLYIGSNNVIYGSNMSFFFYNLKAVDSISFDNLDTSNVTNMTSMFYNTGYNSTEFVLDLGESFDTSKVTNMNQMFCYTGYTSPVFTLDLGEKFDTSSVTNMGGMFYNTGHSSTVFALDLGEKFDTSKVTNMSSMFYKSGYTSTVFMLDLVKKFDTLNVTNMSHMFYHTGYSSTVFTLNLGEKFDTSNVNDMSSMFHHTGYSSTLFTLNLGEKFNTSNVTNMSYMFRATGYSSTVFTLDLGKKFDTSNVTNMTNMFNHTGYSSTVFTLDLGRKFDTINVTDMNSMFSYTGFSNIELELDLTTFNFNNVTSYNYLFVSRTTQKVYVKNESDKNWIVSKGFSGVTSDNVIVKS